MRYYIYILFITNIISFIYPNEIKYVSNISFSGNIAIKESDIRSNIKLQTPKFFSRSEFSPKKLNKDKIALEAYYKSKGYLEININTEYYFKNEKYITINYYIEEGRQFHLKNLHISGNKIFPTENILLEFIITLNNQYYNPAGIRKELQQLKQKYLEHGKVDIAIMDEIIIDNKDVTARINIFEGNTYYIRNIIIKGLENINEKYVTRELLINPGDLYNIKEINKSQNRIFNSRLFSLVEIRNIKIENENELIDIEIKLREYKSSSIEANIGFKQLEPSQNDIAVTGIDTYVKWIIGNVMNTSSNIEIQARLASEINSKIFQSTPLIERDISLSYRNPWTFSLKLPFRIRLFHEEESGDENILKNGVTYSLWFKKDIDIRYEINSTIEFIKSSVDSIHNDEERYIEFKFISNKILQPINPIGGHYFSFSSSLYGTILGGSTNFIKIKSEYRRYYKSFINNIIAIRLTGGYIYNYEGNNYLRKGYKFYFGGHTTLRGWTKPEETERPYGALINNMFNIEYRIPIWEKWGIYLFFDSGKLYDAYNDILTANIIWDYGIGLIYNTKLGPIRLDLGFPYGSTSDGELHASLLYMF